ncbi:MAG: DegV family EDD domain-containing protein [Lachnospiraceae bacterium]|nr:DegV family EDD domain-containing protein [Lachnospiraceae bacterium]
MPKRIARRVRDYLYNSNYELDRRLFYLITGLGTLASIIGIVIAFITHAKIYSIIAMCLFPVVFAIFGVIARKTGYVGFCSVASSLLVNLFIFPMLFLAGDGVDGGLSALFILGLLYVYLMLKGIAFIITLVLSVASFTACYLFTYYNKVYVEGAAASKDIYIHTFVCFMLVSLALGTLVKFQRWIYNKEQEASSKQQIELEEANRTKSRFLANMSHEIRTPINTIIGLNEMNLRDNINDEVAENCVNIQRASKMLLSLINDILDLSKIESGKMEIVNRQYEMGALLSELVNINWVRAYDKKLEFKLDIAPDIPSMLYGDDIRIKQILTNMLTNAIKYTHKGSVTLQAKCQQIDTGHVNLVISVSDTGIGIRKEDIKYLFMSFKRVDEKKNGAIEGTGLGLAISHQLAELMGGEIQVDSVYQRGTTFTLVLGQEIVNKSPMGPIKDIMKGSARDRKEYKQSFEAPEARVLVVDDNEMNLMVAVKLLRATKVQVETAQDGQECLDMTRKKYYHAIFMDHMMPKLDGIETLKKLRLQENGLCKETPVIAMTANAFTDAEAFYNANGFEGYLVKPVNGQLFEAMLLKFLPEEIVEVSDVAKEADGPDLQMVYVHNKKSVCITTESVCDIPEDFLARFGILCIYYYVQTEDGRFNDICEISTDNLIEYIDKGKKKAYSMPPSVEEYETFFADALGGAQQVIHISMAKNTGDGFNNAVQAANGFDNVHVINSAHLSSGMGILVMYAASMVQEGRHFQEIIDKINSIKGSISTSFIVADTGNLYRAGRMNKNVKDICDLFMLHPVLSMKGSQIVCSSVYPGTQEHAYLKYIRKQLKGRRNIDTRVLFFTYSGFSYKMKQKILNEINRYQKFDRIIEQQASAAISSNCGSGAFGLLFMKKEKGRYL